MKALNPMRIVVKEVLVYDMCGRVLCRLILIIGSW